MEMKTARGSYLGQSPIVRERISKQYWQQPQPMRTARAAVRLISEVASIDVH